MEEKKITSGALALKEKQQQVITIAATEQPKDIKLRVAAYARVSSSSEDQLNSFAAQNRYYTTLISGKENWTMVAIYADEGITGTSIEKREDFKRLMADCRRGKIDRILVKSISRFARNTKECLEAIRELKALGISICFEKERIDTASISGEMMIAMFASFAQAESESISSNMQWSIQKRMQNGTFNTCLAPMGFELVDGELEINSEEADVIRRIYDEYLQGKNSRDIARMLNQENALDRRWRREAIDYILKNERYAGNALLQKRFTTATIPHKVVRNRGEREMYFLVSSHEAIVPQEVYDRAQTIRKRRRQEMQFPKARPMAQKIYCGCCGSALRAKHVNQTWYWTCRTHEENLLTCPLLPTPEVHIHSAFMHLYFKLKNKGSHILPQMLTNLQTIRYHRMLWSLDIIALNKQISDLLSQNQMLATLKQQGLVDPDIFISKSNELTEQLRAAKLEKERLLEAESDEVIAQTQDLLDVIEAGPDFLTEFDEELFGELVERIVVESDDRLCFRLKNGLELTESIKRTVR